MNDDAEYVEGDLGIPHTVDDDPAPPLTGPGEPAEEEVPFRVPAARHAFLVLFAFIGVQLLCGFVAGITAGVVAAASGVTTEQPEFQEITAQVIRYSLLPIMAVAGIAMFLVARRVAADAIRDGGPMGVGWRPASLVSIAAGIFLGAMVSGVFLLGVALLYRGEGPETAGPLVEMASQGALGRALLAILAVGLAPLIEEFLFRGVLLAGFTRSFGVTPAVMLCTFLFVILHITELLRFWPAAIPLTGLALVAMWLRLQARSVWPAIAAHLGYNGLIVGCVYLASMWVGS